MTVMYVVYARSAFVRALSASITDRTEASPDDQSCSITSDSSSCKAGGTGRARDRLPERVAIYDGR